MCLHGAKTPQETGDTCFLSDIQRQGRFSPFFVAFFFIVVKYA